MNLSRRAPSKAAGAYRWHWLPLLAAMAGPLSATRAAADPPSVEAPRRLSVDDCVAVALKQNSDLLAARFQIEEAEAARDGARGHFAPAIKAEGAVVLRNSPFDLPFAIPGLPGPAPVFRVWDAFTWSATVSAVQPVSVLFAIYDNYKLKDLGVDMAHLRREITHREVAFRVAEGYYRLAQSIRLAEVAATSVGQLETQRKQAESFYTNGVVGKNDVLRADLAVVAARQRLIQSRGQITIARGRLASLMGLTSDADFEPVAFTGEPPPSAPETIEQAEARARVERVELREFSQRLESADKIVKLAYARLFPQVSLVGSYQHNEGSAFTQRNAAYVGALASWDAWDWGTTTSGISEAKARMRQAFVGRTKLEDAVRQEVRQAYVNEAVAAEARTVASAAVVQAEENFRLITKRYEANASTSFDVVDAEQLLTQSRAQKETTLYDYLVARAALARAVGASPR